MAKNIIEKIRSIAPSIGDIVLEDRDLGVNNDIIELMAIQENITTLYDLRENIEKYGFTQQIADYAKQIGCMELFNDTTVSLQSFIDVGDDADATKEIVLNGIGGAIKTGAEKIRKLIAAIIVRFKSLFKSETAWEKYTNELEIIGEELFEKFDWGKINPFSVGIARVIKMPVSINFHKAILSWDPRELINLFDPTRVTTTADIPNTMKVCDALYIIVANNLGTISYDKSLEKQKIDKPTFGDLKFKRHFKDYYSAVSDSVEHMKSLNTYASEIVGAVEEFKDDLRKLTDEELVKRIRYKTLVEIWLLNELTNNIVKLASIDTAVAIAIFKSLIKVSKKG